MAKPLSRNEFIAFCMRRLGAPVINIEVSNEQIDDCVDLTIDKFHRYNFNGSDRMFYRYQMTQNDIDNGYITLPENILGVVKIFDLSSFVGGSADLLQPQFQFILGTLPIFGAGTFSIVPYAMAMHHLNLLQEMLVPSVNLQFNRHRNRVVFEGSSWKVGVGQFIIVECFEVLDPDIFIDMWGDSWMINYCTQLIKQQWGTNTKKYDDVPQVGGTKINGQKIYDEATYELRNLDDELIDKYSYPPMDLLY